MYCIFECNNPQNKDIVYVFILNGAKYAIYKIPDNAEWEWGTPTLSAMNLWDGIDYSGMKIYDTYEEALSFVHQLKGDLFDINH